MAPEPGRERRGAAGGSAADTYRSLMERRGLLVSERQGRQVTLTGDTVVYHSVSGYRQGSYRVTVRLSPEAHAQIVADASSGEQARRMADRLRSLGFEVEVEEERVRASTRKPSPAIISRALDIVEEG